MRARWTEMIACGAFLLAFHTTIATQGLLAGWLLAPLALLTGRWITR